MPGDILRSADFVKETRAGFAVRVEGAARAEVAPTRTFSDLPQAVVLHQGWACGCRSVALGVSSSFLPECVSCTVKEPMIRSPCGLWFDKAYRVTILEGCMLDFNCASGWTRHETRRNPALFTPVHKTRRPNPKP